MFNRDSLFSTPACRGVQVWSICAIHWIAIKEEGNCIPLSRDHTDNAKQKLIKKKKNKKKPLKIEKQVLDVTERPRSGRQSVSDRVAKLLCTNSWIRLRVVMGLPGVSKRSYFNRLYATIGLI